MAANMYRYCPLANAMHGESNCAALQRYGPIPKRGLTESVHALGSTFTSNRQRLFDYAAGRLLWAVLLLLTDIHIALIGRLHYSVIGPLVSKNVRLTCDQKLVKASLIYRTEPKQNRLCKKRRAARVRCVRPGERVRTYGGKVRTYSAMWTLHNWTELGTPVRTFTANVRFHAVRFSSVQ